MLVPSRQDPPAIARKFAANPRMPNSSEARISRTSQGIACSRDSTSGRGRFSWASRAKRSRDLPPRGAESRESRATLSNPSSLTNSGFIRRSFAWLPTGSRGSVTRLERSRAEGIPGNVADECCPEDNRRRARGGERPQERSVSPGEEPRVGRIRVDERVQHSALGPTRVLPQVLVGESPGSWRAVECRWTHRAYPGDERRRAVHRHRHTRQEANPERHEVRRAADAEPAQAERRGKGDADEADDQTQALVEIIPGCLLLLDQLDDLVVDVVEAEPGGGVVGLHRLSRVAASSDETTRNDGAARSAGAADPCRSRFRLGS